MAVRPIDANTLIDKWRQVQRNFKRGGESHWAELADMVIDDVSRAPTLLLVDINTVPTLTPPNEWVSVEERLPEEKQRVIVRCERVGTSVGWILWGNWMTDIGPGAGKVTHWMPLPSPPKEETYEK